MLVTLQRNRLLLALASSAVFLFLAIPTTFAQSPDTISEGFNVAQNIGAGALGTNDLRDIIVNVVNIALGFLGIIAVIIIMYGGYLWMTSGGNQEQVDRAKKTLRNAVIGLFIILSSWAIVAYFVNAFIQGTGGTGSITQPQSNFGNGALGAGIVESVYPAPNAGGIPRNTKIFVTFKEPMFRNSIIAGSNALQPAAVSILDITDPANVTLPNNVQVTASGGDRVFTFSPGLLGTNTEPHRYRIELNDAILKADGVTSAFPSAIGGVGFAWEFTVSTIIDITPPTLVSFNPVPLSTNPRNILVNMVFSEAINPTTIRPTTVTINDLNLGTAVTGTLYQGSDYRTVEFLPDAQCDSQPVNTCGEPVFCLPANTTFESFITAAGISGTPVGIEDAAGNSFDGNSNGVEDGPTGAARDLATTPNNPPPPGDNAFWNFDTNDTIDLVPPAVMERRPNTGDTAHPVSQELMIKMDKHLSISSLLPDGSYGNGKEYVTLVDPRREVGYWVNGTNGNGCSTLCTNQGSSSVFGSVCGNNVIDQGEDCDDGNLRAGDGCSANCLNEGAGTCGDGKVTHHEECDPNVDPWLTGGGCTTNTCLLTGSQGGACGSITGTNCCGNGTIDPGEQCDNVNDPGCDINTCLYPGSSASCGNGIVEFAQGENCDDANSVSGDGCSATCTLEGATCGDGNLDIGEDCDGGVGCSTICQNMGSFLTCGDGSNTPPWGTPQPGEDCDLGPVTRESFIFLRHTDLRESTQYGVRLGSGIRDTFQNCFLPSAESLPASRGGVGSYGSCNVEPSALYVYGLAPYQGVSWPNNAFPDCILQ